MPIIFLDVHDAAFLYPYTAIILIFKIICTEAEYECSEVAEYNR